MKVKPLITYCDEISKRPELEKALSLLCLIFPMYWHTFLSQGSVN